MSTIEISPEMEDIFLRLFYCQDMRTGSQSFVGTIKVDIVGDRCVLSPEDPFWSTESGESININMVRSPHHANAKRRYESAGFPAVDPFGDSSPGAGPLVLSESDEDP
jgi:hypothetical protein